MSRLVDWLTSKPFWALIAVILVSFLIWWRGAIVAFGDWRPLETDKAQWTSIAILFTLYAIWLVVRWWRVKNINARLLNHLARSSPAPAAESHDGEEEVAELRKRFQTATGVLKNAKLGSKATGAFGWLGGQYIYQLPWYIFVGSPGSGKTTALINSGLQFPLAEQFGKAAIRGVGGTRNCDWWFTNEAVMIDTAGRYTTQDSNDVVDKTEWQGFLKLLRQFRPQQPINGVLLTVSVAELLSQTASARMLHVAVLRQRLEELHSTLGIQFPVYVLVTKIDLLAGFTDYFDALTREERAQVWGFTFPYAPESDMAANFAATFRSELGSLTRRLYAAIPELLLHKRDLQARALAYAFPQQFAGLEDLLEQFLAPLFAQSKFRDAPLMRGVYFTSGTQEGTPFDRVLGALERKFKIDSPVAAPAGRATGKSYFLQNVLEKVIFVESHLAGRDWRRERLHNLVRFGGYACAALLLAGATVGWFGSYGRNSQYLSDVEARVTTLRDATAKSSLDESPLSVVPLLQATRQLSAADRFPVSQPPYSYRFGLYQGRKVDAAADSTYHQLLNDAFLPRVARLAETGLRDAVDQDDLGLIYRRLKTYLMLHDSQRYEPKEVTASVLADLAAEYDALAESRKDVRDALERYLRDLFDGKTVSSPYVQDETLVRDARQRLARVSPAERIYKRIKTELATRNFRDFKLSENAGEKGSQVFTRASGETELRGVPGTFTFNGYRDGFSKEVDKLALSIGGEDAWVLGGSQKGVAQQAASLRDRFDARLVGQVKEMYLNEYVVEWKKFIDDIQLRPMSTTADSIRVTKILSGPDTPLPILLRAIVRETTLLPEEKSGSDSLVQSAAGAIVNKGKEIARSRVSVDFSGATGARANRPELIVDSQFADLRRLVTQPPQGKPPIDDTIAVLKALSDYFVRLQSARESNLTPPNPEPLVNARASTDPELVKRMLVRIAGAGSGQAGEIARSTMNASIGGAVGDPCHRRIDGRFPFFRDSSTDVGLDDFANLFRPNGVFDDYFRKNLADKVNMSTTRPWTLKEGSGMTASSLPSLATFKQAAEIRDAFFASGGGEPSFQVDIRVKALDPAVKEAVLSVDGQPFSFSTASPGPRTIKWPGAGGGLVRLQLAEGTAPLEATGTWALHRLFRRAHISGTGKPESFLAAFVQGGRQVEFEVVARSVANPLHLPALEQFRCPAKS
jgi:type VI secretion system protein ImpL